MINTIIWAVFQILEFIIIVDVILSYFLRPDNVVRSTLDKIVEPMLRPIRKIIPSLGGFDFSPVILILVLWGIEKLLLWVI
jgi:YggT family protein